MGWSHVQTRGSRTRKWSHRFTSGMVLKVHRKDGSYKFTRGLIFIS